MKILMICQPLFNRGDESAHKGLVRKLLNSNMNINITVLFVNQPEDVIKEFQVSNDRVRYINLKSSMLYEFAWRKGLTIDILWYLHPTILQIVRYMRNSDYIMCAPGGMDLGGFQDWYHLFWLKLAKKINCRIIYYGRSIGPFYDNTKDNRKFKKWSLDVMSSFSFLSIRDLKSQQIADSLSIPYVSTTDSAFLDYPIADLDNNQFSFLDIDYAVFVPNLLIWHPAYRDKISKNQIIDFYCKIVQLMIESYPSYKIVMLPQCFGCDEYEYQDVLFFKEIRDIIHDQRVIVLNDNLSSDIQQTIIKRARYLIGARYHSVVFSINQSIPFVALSYEHKIEGLLKSVGYEQRMIDIKHIYDLNTHSNILDKIKMMIKDLRVDNEARDKAVCKAEKCFSQLLGFLMSGLDRNKY